MRQQIFYESDFQTTSLVLDRLWLCWHKEQDTHGNVLSIAVLVFFIVFTVNIHIISQETDHDDRPDVNIKSEDFCIADLWWQRQGWVWEESSVQCVHSTAVQWSPCVQLYCTVQARPHRLRCDQSQSRPVRRQTPASEQTAETGRHWTLDRQLRPLTCIAV